ncbi:MAG: hypothetical protein GX610_03640, partial [Rhodococcus sp.]|nr:hypothetical protein [Rhodococcus sp. (in: high G+C Gram-positive bacteria)]
GQPPQYGTTPQTPPPAAGPQPGPVPNWQPAGAPAAQQDATPGSRHRTPDGPQKKKWVIVGAAAAALVVVGGIVAGVTLLGGSDDPAAAGETTAAVGATTDEPLTEMDAIRAAIPAMINRDLEECTKTGFTENTGVEITCQFKDDSRLIDGFESYSYSVIASVDKKQAKENLLFYRGGYGSGELLENPARTAGASLSKHGYLNYANNETGLELAMSVDSPEEGKTFLDRSGLMK